MGFVAGLSGNHFSRKKDVKVSTSKPISTALKIALGGILSMNRRSLNQNVGLNW